MSRHTPFLRQAATDERVRDAGPHCPVCGGSWRSRGYFWHRKARIPEGAVMGLAFDCEAIMRRRVPEPPACTHGWRSWLVCPECSQVAAL